MLEYKTIRCTKIGVDCCPNDPVDRRCGGPDYLGFDFFVEKEKKEEMKEYIQETLNTLQVPLANIYEAGEYNLRPESVWNHKRILAAIEKEAEYLIGEAERHYPPRMY